MRTHCCGHIVAHDVSWAALTGKHLLRTKYFWTKSVTFFVSATNAACVGKQRNMCVGNNVSSFARALNHNLRSRRVWQSVNDRAAFTTEMINIWSHDSLVRRHVYFSSSWNQYFEDRLHLPYLNPKKRKTRCLFRDGRHFYIIEPFWGGPGHGVRFSKREAPSPERFKNCTVK